MKNKFTVIIPARMKSSRLPGKPLRVINGKPLIQHTWEKAMKSKAERVIIATESTEVFRVARDFGAEVCLTSAEHNSGIERIAEVIETLQIPEDEIIVNLQGDEPMVHPGLVNQVARLLGSEKSARVSTLSEELEGFDNFFSPGNVKVLLDKKGYALYFSRAPIPWPRDFVEMSSKENGEVRLSVSDEGHAPVCLKHIGIYAYRAGFVTEYQSLTRSDIEEVEVLEQLRIIWNGERVRVGLARYPAGIGVDTPEDLEKVRAELEG